MKRLDTFTKAMLALIAAGLWVLILRPMLRPAAVNAATQEKEVVPKVVRAERFEAVDAEGNVKGVLTVTNDGSALALYDRDGRMRAGLAMRPDQNPSLCLYDKRANIPFQVSIHDEGGPVLGLRDSESKVRLIVALAPDGAPSLVLSDKEEKRRAMLDLWEGTPELRLYDGEGKARAVLGATELETIKTGETRRTAESSLVLFDKEGKVMWKAP